MSGLSQIGSIVTSLGLSTGPYVNKEIRGSVAGAYSLTGSQIPFLLDGERADGQAVVAFYS